MNKKLLRSKMALYGDTNRSLASAIGISSQSLSAKINETNGAEFGQAEMEVIRQRYKLGNDEFIAMFFDDLKD